jgi:hypothetical protein
MNSHVEFLVWLAQNQPDCLNQNAESKDWGEKAFKKIYKDFLVWRGEELPVESALLKEMQNADDTLATTDYNTGYLNGMEKALSIIQQRDPDFIPTERLKLPKEALKLKDAIGHYRSIPKNGNGSDLGL